MAKTNNRPAAGGEAHIRYEVVIMAQLARRWAESLLVLSARETQWFSPGSDEALDYTAVLEATLLHTRALVEFLTKETPNTRCATDFATTWDLVAAAERHEALWIRLNKELSHIDVNRPTDPWDLVEVTSAVCTDFRSFLDKIDRPCDIQTLRKAGSIAQDELRRAAQLQSEVPVEFRSHRP